VQKVLVAVVLCALAWPSETVAQPPITAVEARMAIVLWWESPATVDRCHRHSPRTVSCVLTATWEDDFGTATWVERLRVRRVNGRLRVFSI
jgi:hypothetical protein